MPSLLEQIAHLEKTELVRLAATQPELAYSFKHALIQAAAYQTLRRADRKHLHQLTAEVMEDIYAERLHEFYGELAEHYRQSDVWHQAAHYHRKAGEVAQQRYAHAEARTHYADALDALAQLPNTGAWQRQRVDVIIQLSSISFAAEDPAKNLARLTEAAAVLQSLPEDDVTPNRLRLARVQYWRGFSHYVRGELPAAIEYFQQVLQVAQEFNDAELLAIPASTLGRVFQAQGYYNRSGTLLAQALAPLEKVGNKIEGVFALSSLGASLAIRGQCHAGLAMAQRALSQAQTMRHAAGIAASQLCIAVVYLQLGDWACMLDSSRAMVATAQASGEWLYGYYGHAYCAWAECRLGHHEAAAQNLAQSQAIAQRIGRRLFYADLIAAIAAELALHAGRYAEAIALAQHAVTLAQAVGGISAEGLARRTWGLALAQHQPTAWAETEAQLAESVRLHELGEGKVEIARTRVLWGHACRERGDHTLARTHFAQALIQFEASELLEDVERMRVLLATV